MNVVQCFGQCPMLRHFQRRRQGTHYFLKLGSRLVRSLKRSTNFGANRTPLSYFAPTFEGRKETNSNKRIGYFFILLHKDVTTNSVA